MSDHPQNKFHQEVSLGACRKDKESGTLDVDETTMYARTSFEVKVLKIDKVGKIAHSSCCDQIAAAKA